MLAAAAPLENVPDSEKDWHPGSDGLVLDLVHPSLYPIVYGRSISQGSDFAPAAVLAAPEFDESDFKFASEKFQWLPSDFLVDNDGKVTLISPYINNVHPTQHGDLYSVISEILQSAIPIFEPVLSDLLRPLLPMRIATSDPSRTAADCIWENGVPYPNSSSEEEYDDDPEKWMDKRGFTTPDANKCYEGDLQVMKNRISLKGRTLQVIVKLANVVLTPEKPSYPGGKWHVEGLCRLFPAPGYC